ncbi:MAG: ATP-dependent zinc metalloprotease FtsH [Fusobacteriaceae bacterium]|nr:ATP-dependent zinc metalloprotease FtsH [Fusobacteriaceae bacterium]
MNKEQTDDETTENSESQQTESSQEKISLEKESNSENSESENSEPDEKKEKSPKDILRERQEEIKRRLKEDNPKPQNNKIPNIFRGKFNFKGLILLAFVIAIVMSIPTIRNERKKIPITDVTYTQFIELLKTSKIDKVMEKEDYIIGSFDNDTNSYRTRLLTSRIGDDQKVMSVLEEKKIPIQSLPPEQPNALITMLGSWFPFILLIGIWAFMLNRMNKGNGGGPQIFNMGKSKTKEGESISKVTFKDVAGIVEAKAELEEVVEFLREPDKFKKVGAKIPKGVLLLGAPGTGKTLLAKAVAGEAKVPFFSMSGSEFVEMFVGVGASRVRDLFNKARKSAPCIVFIDEIDAVGRKRGTGSGGGNDEREQTLNQLLVEMDGFGNEETIIVLAATNRPDVLDRALLRPGRFDRRVYVDVPDIKGREAILRVHLKGKTLDKDVNLKAIAKQTHGLVGADLANLLNEAAILAARAGRKNIKMIDIQEATEKVAMGPEKKSRVVSEKDRKITAYHEAGHAVVTYNLKGVDPVYKVTIVPRGWAGGYTMSLPDSEIEKTHMLKSDFVNEIKILFGGRASEEIIFEDISTGASQDIERATGIANAMVTKYGMVSKFGPILLDSTRDGDMFRSRNYSEITGKEVDDEIFKIINENYKETLEILKEHRTQLEAVAIALLDRDTINKEEFEAAMRGEALPPLESTDIN